MNAIIANLVDPSWWFSGVFIGIVVGVAGGFLKDRIERYFSSVSANYRQKRKKALERRNSEIEVLAKNPTYLSFMLNRATFRLIHWVLATILFFCIPLLLNAAPLPGNNSIGSFLVGFIRHILSPVTGIVAIYAAFRSSNEISLLMAATYRYRKLNNIPYVR